MNKFAAFLFLGCFLSVSQGAQAQVNIYTSNTNTSPMVDASNLEGPGFYRVQNTTPSNTTTQQNAQQQGANYDARLNQILRDIEQRNQTNPSLAAQYPELLGTQGMTVTPQPEQKKTAKKREMIQRKQVVNGIQGTWLPKKVWENDVDNDLAKTLLKQQAESGSRTISGTDAIGTSRATSGNLVNDVNATQNPQPGVGRQPLSR